MVTVGALIAWTLFMSFVALWALAVPALFPRKPTTAIECPGDAIRLRVPEPDDEFWREP